MECFLLSFVASPVSPRRKLIIWAVGLGIVVALGVLRNFTDAEYAFASAVIIPVVAVAWIAGCGSGLALSLLAAVMWITTDLLAERQFREPWIPFANGLTRLATYGFVVYLITRVKTMMIQMREMASRDALTGLLNRRAFFEAGEAEVMRSRRYGHPIAVAFLDLDNFKQLNDIRGHKAGDAALKAVALALEAQLRTTDRLARLGGDEFAVLLPQVTYQATSEIGSKLATGVEAALLAYPPASVSVGIAWFDTAVLDFSAMLEAADTLMYKIKQSGKRGVRTQAVTATVPSLNSAEFL